jgi:hypothetical protein
MMLLEVPDLGNVKIGAACGIAPTLRTEREEWGTHFVGCLRVIERLGHPPKSGAPILLGVRVIASPGHPPRGNLGPDSLHIRESEDRQRG